jgi:hypothetical protein
MEVKNAIASIRSMPDIRRAVIMVLDQAILEAEERLIKSSPTDEKAIIYARQRLDGAVAVRASVVRQLGAPQKLDLGETL